MRKVSKLGIESTSHLTLLLHPVRMRLVNAVHAGPTVTTSELCVQLPDLPKATVYRHVELLLNGGVLEVDSEQRKRGAVERRYRIARGGALMDPEAARSMTRQDHRRAFTAAMGALLAEFNAYLDAGRADPTADCVSYRQMTLWLSPAERSRLVADVAQRLALALANKPGSSRAPHLLSTIFFPTGKAPRSRTAPRSGRPSKSPGAAGPSVPRARPRHAQARSAATTSSPRRRPSTD
jgi:DNA-binding transcriptional ArsR family regulator